MDCQLRIPFHLPGRSPCPGVFIPRLFHSSRSIASPSPRAWPYLAVLACLARKTYQERNVQEGLEVSDQECRDAGKLQFKEPQLDQCLFCRILFYPFLVAIKCVHTKLVRQLGYPLTRTLLVNLCKASLQVNPSGYMAIIVFEFLPSCLTLLATLAMIRVVTTSASSFALPDDVGTI